MRAKKGIIHILLLRNRLFLSICLAGVFLWIFASQASGQGFVVRPMKIEFASKAGEDVEGTFELRNFDVKKSKTLHFSLVDITQGENGKIQIVDPYSDIDGSAEFSCLKWTEINMKTVEIPPLSKATIKVIVHIPSDARGFYSAGLVAQSQPESRTGGLALAVRFVVPIFVSIQDRLIRQKIALEDVGMQFVEQNRDKPASSYATLNIVNSGKAYSRLKASIGIMYLSEGHWQHVTTTEFRKTAIMPGLKLKLSADMQRNLPSGRYRLKGILYVDGRRLTPLVKEVDYTGDPDITKLAVDTSLILEPKYIMIDAVPGGTRTATLKVENISVETVEIETSPVVVDTLRGVALGELTGNDLMCHDWVKIIPENFALRSGGKQNIRIVCSMPKSEEMQANYYAGLNLRARYHDGQKAGDTNTTICLKNKNVKAKPVVNVVGFDIVSDEASRYIITARFGNIGNVHLNPVCKVTVSRIKGGTLLEKMLNGEEGLLLPLEIRNYSGILDFSNIDEGNYLITVSIEYDDGNIATEERAVRVLVEGEDKIVEIIHGNAEVKENE